MHAEGLVISRQTKLPSVSLQTLCSRFLVSKVGKYRDFVGFCLCKLVGLYVDHLLCVRPWGFKSRACLLSLHFASIYVEAFFKEALPLATCFVSVIATKLVKSLRVGIELYVLSALRW